MNNYIIDFTLAQPHELDGIFAMFQAAVTELDRIGIPQWDELYPDMGILREDIERQELYIGRIDGTPVCAFVLNNECDDEYANGAWSRPDAGFCVIHRLCVHPEFQHHGIGRRTMEHIEKLALSLGFDEIRLDTFTRNPYSIRLYEHLGYRTVGTVRWRKGDFLLMEKSLLQQNYPEATDHENET